MKQKRKIVVMIAMMKNILMIINGNGFVEHFSRFLFFPIFFVMVTSRISYSILFGLCSVMSSELLMN